MTNHADPVDSYPRPARQNRDERLPHNVRRAIRRVLSTSPVPDLVAWAGFALLSLVVLWPVGLTNRVLAGVDAFTYFQPYWAYRTEMLRAGQFPLWNPYLFLGVPFLANPQAAVLYPPHWLLSWLPAERALIWSAVLHVWLAAGFMYTFARRSLRLERSAAWLAGLLYGLSGYALARVENINQLNGMAWLPALLWLYDEVIVAGDWRRRLRWGVGLTLAIALQLLAGHSQTSFVNLIGLALYAAYLPGKWALAHLYHSWRAGDAKPACSPRRQLARILPLVAVLPAMALAAAQLLPSNELNQLGLRTGGLSYRQAVSFSLRPQLLAWTFLPPFRGGLAEAFSGEGYAEFVAYIGITGIVLAGIAIFGLMRTRNGGFRRAPDVSAAPDKSPPTISASLERGAPGALVLLSVTGIFLALGAYNPLYYVLWRFVPGFDLFRAPVRWLELYVLGMAGLAGIGLATVIRPGAHSDSVPGISMAGRQGRGWLIAVLIALVGFLGLMALQQWPTPQTVLIWSATIVLVAAALVLVRRRPALASTALLALAIGEMWVASRAMPYTLATAPFVSSLRDAPAALLAQTDGQPPAGRDRFVSMSDIRYDPGDLTELRALEADRLPPDAVERMVRGAKQTEVIAPNLPLRLELPTIDGYDGGLLPTDDYRKLQTLFLPPEQRLPDGRMREQLRQIPPARLLDLTGVGFVITDKQNDLWAGDVYYDLEQAASLRPGATLELDLTDYPRFSATDLGLVSYMQGAASQGSTVAELAVRDASGQSYVLPVRAGVETAPGQGLPGNAKVARAWPDWIGAEGYDYLAKLNLPTPLTPKAISIRIPPSARTDFVLRGLSLIDDRTGAHVSVTVSPSGDYRRVHSGDVKVYERIGAPGRVWLVHSVEHAEDDAAALELLADPGFDPRNKAVVTGGSVPQALTADVESSARETSPSTQGQGATAAEGVKLLEFGPEHIRIQADTAAPAMLVLADAFYPGWEASVDGVRVPILRTNLMFRGLYLEPGSHDVVFNYRPSSWRWGLGISLISAVLLVGALVVTWQRKRRSPPYARIPANLP